MSCMTTLGMDPLLLLSVQPTVKLELHDAASDGNGDGAAQPRYMWMTFQRLRLKIRRCDDEMSVPASTALASNWLTPAGEAKEEKVFIGLPSPPDDFLYITPKEELKAEGTLDTLGQQPRTIIDDGQLEPSCRASELELSSRVYRVLDGASCDGVKVEPKDEDECFIDEGKLKPVLDEGELKPVLDEGELKLVLDEGELKPVLAKGGLEAVLKSRHKEVLDEGATAPPSHCGKIGSLRSQRMPWELASQCNINSANDSNNSHCSLDASGTSQRQPMNRPAASATAPPSHCGKIGSLRSQRTPWELASQCSINSANDSNKSHCSLDASGTSQRQPMNRPAASSYQCEVCDKSFRHRGWLSQHRRVHTGARACSGGTAGTSPDQTILAKTFNRASSMMTGTGKSHSCVTCDSNFAANLHLVQHMKVHTGKRQHKCSACGRTFATKYRLLDHVRTHTGEKPYKCETCGRTFATRAVLVRHIRTHTGEKPYKCEICGRTFARRITLTLHLRTHTREKPYMCEACGREFAVRNYLVEHVRTHTGEKRYKCETCGRAFAHRKYLVQHVRTHTGEIPYKCETCGRTYAIKRNLSIHMRTHTGEKP